MTPEEAAMSLTYANQIDARVQLNPANLDVWASALKNAKVEQVRWAIKQHQTTPPPARGDRPAIDPGIIWQLIHSKRESVEAKRRALSPPERPAFDPVSWRKRNPELWDAEVERGKQQRLEELNKKSPKPSA